jgi:hypothetical protein
VDRLVDSFVVLSIALRRRARRIRGGLPALLLIPTLESSNSRIDPTRASNVGMAVTQFPAETALEPARNGLRGRVDLDRSGD